MEIEDLLEVIDRHIGYPSFDDCAYRNIYKQWFKHDGLYNRIVRRLELSEDMDEGSIEYRVISACLSEFDDAYEELWEYARESVESNERARNFARGLFMGSISSRSGTLSGGE